MVWKKMEYKLQFELHHDLVTIVTIAFDLNLIPLVGPQNQGFDWV